MRLVDWIFKRRWRQVVRIPQKRGFIGGNEQYLSRVAESRMDNAVGGSWSAPWNGLREWIPPAEHAVAQQIKQMMKTADVDVTKHLIDVLESEREVVLPFFDHLFCDVERHDRCAFAHHGSGIVLVQRVALMHQAALGMDHHGPNEHQVFGRDRLIEEFQNAAMQSRILARIALILQMSVCLFLRARRALSSASLLFFS